MARTTEALVLVLTCLSPWPFASVQPKYEFLLDLGIALLTVLWGARMLLAGTVSWRKCPVTAYLAALVLLGLAQSIPLPRGVLATLAPATGRLYDTTLPARPESLPLGAARADPRPPAGSTLSVYPAATRSEAARLLAVLLLFAVVRNQVASAMSLRRLSAFALINGSLLAVFGLVQAFSADPHTVYWSIATGGEVFGPFVNRNHYAFYMNICVSLGIGFLLARLVGQEGVGSASSRVRLLRSGRRSEAERALGWLRWLPGAIPEAETLGILFALALMASSVVVCLSRGGLLALVAGSLVGLAIWVFGSQRSARGRIVLLAPAVMLALVSWVGLDRVATRLEALRGSAVLKDDRLSYWSRALPMVRDFPLWGTGLGTYAFMEPLYRDDATQADVFVEHAHNDYLEVLTEAGLFGLLASLLALFLLCWHGLRAIRRDAGRPAGALALGALIGLATIAFHSVTDFSLHMPANAVLATVLCAHLCARGQEALEDQPDPAEDSPAFGLRDRVLGPVPWLAPLLATAVVVALGFGLAERGWSKAQAAHLRRLTFAQDRASEQGRSDRKVALLEAAARRAPGDAELQSEAAYAHLGAMAMKRWLLSAPRVSPGGSAPQQPGPAPGAGPDPAALERLTRAHLLPALRFLLRARDLCPVRAVAHLDLANHVADLASADPQAAYLQRVELLAPADPWLWYQCGVTALAAGRSAEAWADWRGSLALSTAHLPEILERSRAHLDSRGILRDVLPDEPDILLEAARALYPQPDDGRRPFLERALASLERRGQPPSARDLRTRATIHRELGQPAQAIEVYRAALLREPNHPRWRYELAELSYEQGQYEDAHQELLTILALEPRNARARTLLDAVARGLAEHR